MKKNTVIINNQKKSINLPDFFVAGAPRSGTTSLYQYLYFHPQIFLTTPKEPHFFFLHGLSDEALTYCNPMMRKVSASNIEAYSRLFRKAKGRICGDMSVENMKHGKHFVSNVEKFYNGINKPKVIVALRNPIQAAFSYYNFLINYGVKLENTFLEQLKKSKMEFDAHLPACLSAGSLIHTYNYPSQLKIVSDYFNDVYIYTLDDMKKDPRRVLFDIDRFLGVEEKAPDDLGETYNMSSAGKKSWIFNTKADRLKIWVAQFIPEATGRRLMTKIRAKTMHKAEMTPEERALALTLFTPIIKETAKLLNRDLSSWLV